MAGGMLFILPVVFWNSRHGWITLFHTISHFETDAAGFKQRIIWLGEFLGSQFGIVSPMTFGLILVIASLALRSIRRLERRERYLFFFGILPMLGVLALTFRQRVQPNWPAVIYPAAVILMVAWILECPERARAPQAGIQALRKALQVSVIFIALTYLIPIGWGLKGTNLDPAARLRGWDSLGKGIGISLKRFPNPQKTFVLVTSGRATASELAFYLPDQPQVYLYNSSRQVLSQYDIWPSSWEKAGWDALIVTGITESPPSELVGRFRQIRFLNRVVIPIGGEKTHAYSLWQGIEVLAKDPRFDRAYD
jgi:hypothetical protein